ncbi:MAG: hypothetical protein ABIM19_07020, partial [candidate division WOR-3 bacterium]
SVFTKALLCLGRLRGGYAKLLCPKNLRAILHQNLFLGGESCEISKTGQFGLYQGYIVII